MSSEEHHHSLHPNLPPEIEPRESAQEHAQREERVREREMASLRDAARHLGMDKLRDGSWFRRTVAAHVKKHFDAIEPSHWDRVYPGLDVEERAHKHIVGVARRAAAAGMLASIGASTGELLSLFTDGLAAPVGVPAAAISMGLEAAYTALLQIDLACDLASIYGVPFDADDVGEVATLFGLALEVPIKKDATNKHAEAAPEPELPSGLTVQLMELEDGDIAQRIGKKLLEESLMRNVVPIIGVAISARWNYVATMKLGATVKRYVRYRRALEHAFKRIQLDTTCDAALLVEGAWLLATIDGEVGHEEVLALALLMDRLPPEKRKVVELDKTLGDDEEAWFAELAQAPPHLFDSLVDVLYLVAGSDREIEPGERRFLRRVGKTIGREIDFDRVEQVCKHFANGEDLPDGFLPCIKS